MIHTRRGFSVQIWAQNTIPNLDVFDRDWVKLAHVGYVQSGQKIPIDTGMTCYGYYLVWITRLPAWHDSVSLNDGALYRYSYS